MKLLLLILTNFFVTANFAGINVFDSSVIHIDQPVPSKVYKFTQRLLYESAVDTVVSVRLSSYYYTTDNDSLHLYDLRFENIRLRKGAHYIDIPFSKALSTQKMHGGYFAVIKKFRMVPAGRYRTELDLYAAGDKGLLLQTRVFEQDVDSVLSYSSGLREQMDAAVAGPKSARQRVQQKVSKTPGSDQQVAAAQKKLNRNLRSVKGLDMRQVSLGGKSYSEAWYEGFFLGRYELGSVAELKERAREEQNKLSSNSSSLVSNELEGFQGVGTQFRELNTKKDRETKVKGMVDISSSRANAQDPQSVVDQNYTEVLVSTDLDLLGIPFSFEGFYTTQDQDRKAKASYFRFHYDIESAKSKLQSAIGAYKSKLTETGAKGQGLESIYGSYAKNLEGQKSSLLSKMAKDYELDPAIITKNGGNVDKILSEEEKGGSVSSSDTGKAAKAQARKQKLQKDRKNIAERYQKIVELEQKAEKYYKLIDNYKTRNHLDSAVSYKKIAALEDKDPSYKDLSKAASGILPEGKAKNFMTGLTSFDAGIINKDESAYTMSGQTLKGLSMGYDLGIVKAGITAGSSEYISREGNVDHYSTMLLRVDNKKADKHKVGLLYNISTPANSMSVDENFIGKQAIRYPGFSRPTQVLSVVYDGKLSRSLSFQTELASSFKKDQSTSFDMAHAAINSSLAYAIPRTPVSVSGSWEHLGNSFENNTLPYVRTGTERYTLGASASLFRSVVHLKVDYNYLVQENFSTTSYNRKWGFDVRTNSKRYPTLSLSYKPFSTFRSLSDTLRIAQRPIQGEVWTVRAAYQFRRNKKVHRFTALYNRNSSTADTIEYSSSMMQAGYMYTAGSLSVNVNVGRMELPASFADGSGMVSSYTATVAFSKQIGRYLNVMLSPDLAFCNWGVQRKSGTAGISCKIPGKPLTLRTMLRYSSYKVEEQAAEQEVYNGLLGLNWQFKAEKKRRVAVQ
jgi:hypothetical protein